MYLKTMNPSDVSDFIFELSVLKKLPRSGSFIAGVAQPDTVGEHVFRAAEIAFVLAELEGGNGEHAAFLALIHDNGEARIGDHHRIMNHYFDAGDAEERAFYDQCTRLPKPIAEKFRSAFAEFEERKTIEAICAKDADLLELAFQSKEFLEQGYAGKQNWLDNIQKHLQTDSAKQIFAEMKKKSTNDWWEKIKKA
jgi:putative hydrolase of HD superfamily